MAGVLCIYFGAKIEKLTTESGLKIKTLTKDVAYYKSIVNESHREQVENQMNSHNEPNYLYGSMKTIDIDQSQMIDTSAADGCVDIDRNEELLQSFDQYATRNTDLKLRKCTPLNKYVNVFILKGARNSFRAYLRSKSTNENTLIFSNEHLIDLQGQLPECAYYGNRSVQGTSANPVAAGEEYFVRCHTFVPTFFQGDKNSFIQDRTLLFVYGIGYGLGSHHGVVRCFNAVGYCLDKKTLDRLGHYIITK